MLPVSKCSHILLYLVVGYLSVDLCRADIAVSEHLAERFHRNTIGKANRGIFLSLTRQVIFLLPLMIILPIFFGIEGVMFSAPIADGFAAVCAITFAVKELKSFQKL